MFFANARAELRTHVLLVAESYNRLSQSPVSCKVLYLEIGGKRSGSVPA